MKAGDRGVVPFQISCGHCFMCDQQLYTQCETTQVPRSAWRPTVPPRLGPSSSSPRARPARRHGLARRRLRRHDRPDADDDHKKQGGAVKILLKPRCRPP
nr:alcohol dehydrogenase catalytic domain-containing protein [Frankia tisae]